MADPVAPAGRELPQLRTRRSRTYRRADGRQVTRVYQRSVNYRDGSRWAPIRNRLERAGGRYVNAANDYRLSVPASLGDGPLALERGGRWLRFRLEGARDVRAAVTGDEATFRQALPGVTARWSAQNDAVKEELVLADARAPRSYRFDVEGSAGLTMRTRPDGGLDVLDDAGATAFVVPAAFAYDAKGFEAPRDAVKLSARPGGSGWTVELRVDDEWLSNANFPVTVDPTIEVPSEADDCKLDEEFADTSFCGSQHLEVGWAVYESSPHDHRSILKFDVDQALPPGAEVLDATLNAYLDHRATGSADKAVRVHRVTSPWTDGATWLSRSAGTAWTNPGGDFAPQIEAQETIGGANAWYAWEISDLVEGWAEQTLPNQGLLLKDDGTHVDGGLIFGSTESSPSTVPYLEISYEGGAPAGPSLELSGGLRTPLATTRDLTARAVENGNGVKSVAIWLDPDLDPTQAEAAEVVDDACAPGCPDELIASFTAPAGMSEGRHTVLVRTEDAAGGVTRERWQFHVAALGGVDRSRLGLEQWFQYDSTDVGGDSTMYVNADTGNMVWHSVPIVNPGRGLSTVVNLTYNTHDQGGVLGAALSRLPVFNTGAGELDVDRLAALSYGEVGQGFSISVSGPTRVNEPLRGVILAAAAEEGTPLEGVSVPPTAEGLKIRMTDADGTEHVFTNTGGRWVAPPGLNMRLRRYRPGGSIAAPVADKWALTRADGVTHFFDTLGFLTRTEDRNGNTLSYQYERVNAFDGGACATGDVIGVFVAGAQPRLCSKRLTSVVDAEGRALTISYESGGFLAPPVDGFDATRPLHFPTVIGGTAGRIQQITDHAGRDYRFIYDARGHLVRFEEAANKPDVRVTRFRYEVETRSLFGIGDEQFVDRVQDLRDVDGDGTIGDHELHLETSLAYEDRVAGAPTPGQDRATRRPTTLTKRSGGAKVFTYPSDPKRLEVKEELEWRTHRSATTTHEVDARGRPVRITDALGTATTLTWIDDNKVGRLTRAQGASDESVTDYTYDTVNGTGVLESQTAYPSWPATTDARTTDLVWAFGAGQHLSTAAGVNDATGRFVADLDRFENPKAGTGWDFTFDARGNVTRRTDAKGNFAQTQYDGVGRITKETDEVGAEVDYSDFHATGNPQTVVDERDSAWTYRYDARGNVTSIVDPRASDRSGTEGNPFTTTLSYDAFDRMTREHIPKLSNPNATPEEGESRFITRTRTFDRNGNVTESLDGRGSRTEISYMEMDQPLRVVAPGSAGGPEITRHVYDTGDRLIASIAPKGDGVTTVEEVEETHAEECAGTDPPLAFVTRFCLDDIGRLQAEVRYSARAGDPSSLVSSFAYDRRDNLVGMVDPNRNAGRTLGQAIDAAASPADQRMAYAYNKVDEQTSSTEKPTEAGAQPTVWRYFYDANGNQVEIRHPRGDGIRTHLSYDHRDELIAVEDPLGHLTCLQRRADERVIAQTSPRGTAGAHANCTDGNPSTGYIHFTTKFAYDPAGDLLSRSVPFAPGQYGRTDELLSSWKVIYSRNAVGDPDEITDARGNTFQNSFYDTGDLRTTTRPSFFEATGDGIVERQGRSANAERSDDGRTPDSTLGETDFGKVDPEPLPDLLPQAGQTRFGYDGEMMLTKVRDARDKERLLTYDAAGRLTTRKWPFKTDGITHSFAYDKHGNVTRFTDGRGEQTTYDYDGYDRRIEETAPGAHPSSLSEDPLADVTRVRYDHNGNLRFRETPRGVATAAAGDFTWETGYDSLDRVAFEQAPDGGRTSLAYDVASNVIAETRPRGQGRTGEDVESFQTRMAYDDADRMVESRQQVTDGSELVELVTSLEYDADDNMTRLTEPGAKFSPSQTDVTPRQTAWVHDGRGMPWKVTVGGPSARRTSLVEFDPNGNLRRLVNPRGVDGNDDARVVDSGADTAANLEAASENATVLTYGDNDLQLTRRLPWNGGDTRKFRQVFQRTDPLRRITSILSPHVAEDDTVPRTSYTYYDTDWVASISDQKLTNPERTQRIESRLIGYDYDKRGAQTSWESKNFGETSAGRHITRTLWPSGQLRTRTAKKTVDPDEAPTTRTYQYFYNRNRSLVGMNDRRNPQEAGDDRLTRIDRDSVERQTGVNEVWANGKDTQFAYDVAGNVVTRRSDGKIQPDSSFTGDDAKTATFEYDSLDRELRMEVDPATGANRVTTTNYWPSGRRESRRKPNGTTERWFFSTRDEVSRFERQRQGQSGLAREIDYGYDANGNRDQDERGAHVFNARDQLIKWSKPNGGRVSEYDLNGDGAITEKRVFSSPSDPTPETTTFEYRGERLRWAQTVDVRAYHRYDDFGNVVRIRQRAREGGVFPEVDDNAPRVEGCDDVPEDVANDETYYCYDEFERLRLSRGAGISDPEFVEYDGLDRRDLRVVRTSAGTRTRDYSYVGTSELLSREVEVDGDKRFYDYDSEGDRLGQQVTTGSTTRYRVYTKDANGSVLGLEDDDGDVSSGRRYDYDPYGDLENEGDLDPEGDANPFRFEGFYFDSGVRSYDMHARHYRPDVGRFVTQDRFASASQDLLLQADPVTQNRYAFAGANPVNNIEFDGHGPIVESGAQARALHNARVGARRSGDAPVTDAASGQGYGTVSPRSTSESSTSGSSGGGTGSGSSGGASSGSGSSGGGPFVLRVVKPFGNATSAAGNFAASTAEDTLTAIKHTPGTIQRQVTCRLPLSSRHGTNCPTAEENLEVLETASLATGAAGAGRSLARRLGGPLVDKLAARSAAKDIEEVAPKLGSRGGPGTGSRHISADVKRQEIAASQGLCRVCKQPVEPEAGAPLSRELDHAWPYSRGGDTTLENIQSLCRTCNRQKGAKTTQEYLDWLFRRRG